MRIVALEEHLILGDFVRQISPESLKAWGWPSELPAHMNHQARLNDLGAGRLAAMDEAGISVQVLSVTGAGADLLEGAQGVTFARDYNDTIARAIALNPDRLCGFAHLPMALPQAAADELERCVRVHGFKGALVNGLTRGKFLDHADFEPLLARAESLQVPLYIHPSLPPRAVHTAYFEHLPGDTGFVLSTAGWGWHAEAALHVLRLALSGALDRHRNLKLIVGHMGEGLPMMLARVDAVFTPLTKVYLSRTVSQTLLDQLWITTSGFFSLPPFMAALLSFGVDRILFSVDYPFASNVAARAFLDALPVSPADRLKIAHENADRLLRLTA